MGIRSLIVSIALLAALLVVPAYAQEATPTVDTPDPALCTLNPLTPDDLQRIADAELPPIETPTPVSDPFVMPAGEDLFSSDREEVEKDLRRAIACVNTGEPLKAMAAYTDRWIANFIAEHGGLDDELITGLQVDRNLQPADYLQILGFGDAVRLPDDRVALVLRGENPSNSDSPTNTLFLMAEVRPGRYLIDEVIPIPGS